MKARTKDGAIIGATVGLFTGGIGGAVVGGIGGAMISNVMKPQKKSKMSKKLDKRSRDIMELM